MSEYQFIAFQAVDRPLTDRELEFAEGQSTRAEITRWSFTNEYHFGDFHGDADGLLRGGYDVHLHYANFGIRKIALHLPGGLPFAKPVWSRYVDRARLRWKKDPKGHGGIVTVDPFHESGEIHEIWSPDEYIEDFVEIRNLLVGGDLRALYVLWLCAAGDEYLDPNEEIEPPVPHGLAELAKSSAALLEFFGVDQLILDAAAENVPPAPPQESLEQQISAWAKKLNAKESKRQLGRLLLEDAAAVKAELLADIRKSEGPSAWPTSDTGRTLQDLLERTETMRAEHRAKEKAKQQARAKREAAKRERERQERMKEMVKDPDKWLREADELVEARGTANYEAAAEILADLGEAIGGKGGNRITRIHAAHLVAQHPTLNRLKGSLRKRNLLG
ncbi:MAG: hypothetical protein MI757_07145 [Pirellulales bacterium]|nr:hypothetical protein [Pirellulales bacterium]